mgnify:CR=1 FL=1
MSRCCREGLAVKSRYLIVAGFIAQLFDTHRRQSSGDACFSTPVDCCAVVVDGVLTRGGQKLVGDLRRRCRCKLTPQYARVAGDDGLD